MRSLKHSARLGFLSLLVLASACATMPLLDPRYYELLSQPAPGWLPVPVAGAAKAKLWDSYGDPRSGGRRHEGIDIFAKRNTPVLSARKGMSRGWGRTVWAASRCG
jgi:peptidoglycan LD-endopeptidase LytH